MASGIPIGSSFRLSSPLPTLANACFPTAAARLAAGQLRHASWDYYQEDTATYYRLLPLAQCFLADSTTPATQFDTWGTLNAHWAVNKANSGTGGATSAAITVSLAGGKTWGAIQNGDVIPIGTPFQDLFTRALVEAIYPTYAPAGLGLSQSAAASGEVGEALTNTLTATFAQNDAGALTGLRIQRNGVDLTAGGPASNPTSPSTRTSPEVRGLTPASYQAVAAYGAGAAKPVPPTNTPDTRPAQVRNPNAPQAAETAFGSNTLTVQGYYALFFGPAAAVPANRAQALALGGYARTDQGSQFTLNTGTSATRFVILLPPGRTLTSVTDLDNLNANLLSAYVAQAPISLADAGGTAVPGYTPYVLTAATPYPASARHQFTY